MKRLGTETHRRNRKRENVRKRDRMNLRASMPCRN